MPNTKDIHTLMNRTVSLIEKSIAFKYWEYTHAMMEKQQIAKKPKCVGESENEKEQIDEVRTTRKAE